MFYVYMLLDPRKENQPFYVGKGTDNRWKDHLFETADTSINKRKFSTIQKIMSLELDVGVEFVQYFEDENQAYDFEELLIAKYGRKGYDANGILTNICKDSRPPNWHQGPNAGAINEKIRKTKLEQGSTHTPESKEKISAKLKGKKKPLRSEEHKLALSLAKKGKPLSKPCSEETRRKRSENQTGKKASDETRKAISEGLKGRTLSEEHKAKIKAARLKQKLAKESNTQVLQING